MHPLRRGHGMKGNRPLCQGQSRISRIHACVIQSPLASLYTTATMESFRMDRFNRTIYVILLTHSGKCWNDFGFGIRDLCIDGIFIEMEVVEFIVNVDV